MNESELIEQCLEEIASRAEDIAPLVYQKFFSIYPEAEELFGVDPESNVKFTMIVSLLLELLNLANNENPRYNIERWANDHIGYGATLPMFSTMLNCLHLTIIDVLKEIWSSEFHNAWKKQYEKLQLVIDDVYKCI